MKKYLIAIFAFLTLAAVKCKKADQEDQLPPITTTGANTFGCLVNGNVWLPYSLSHTPAALSVQGPLAGAYQRNALVSISSADTKQGQNSRFYLEIHNLTDTGTYLIYNMLNEGMVYVDNNNLEYEPVDTFGVVKIIRLDTTQQIVSGTFSFKGYTDTTRSRSVSVTSGRFDLHWPYQN